jgi:hypothetical protein
MVLADITDAGMATLASNLGERVAVTTTSSIVLSNNESEFCCDLRAEAIKRKNMKMVALIVLIRMQN